MAAPPEMLAKVKASVNDRLWVNPEYAQEFAVLSAWLSMLIPWSLTYASSSNSDAALFVMRFPYVQIQYVTGLPLVEAFQLRNAYGSMMAEQANNEGLAIAFGIWLVGSVILTVAFVLSLIMYAESDVLDDYRDIAPVRVMGVILLLAAVVMTVSDVFLWQNMPGRQIPVFTLFYYVFAVVLLAIEEPTSDGTAEAT